MTDPARIAEAVEQCWREGDLSYLWHDEQTRWDEARQGATRRVFVVECSRRIGKSMWLCTLAIQEALARDNAQIRYAAPHAKDVKKIVLPHMRAILEDCPEDMRPTFNAQDGVWTFGNGSQIHIAGCNSGNAESLRGVASHLCLVDEAGFVDELRYVVFDILLPQTLTTDGRIVLASTPAKSPAHDFTAYCAEAEAAGSYVHATIYDAPHVREDQIAEYMEESGGEQSSTWRREYLAQRVVDEESAIVPEFVSAEVDIVEDLEIPPYRDCYVVADLGFVDLSFWLLGYYDFRRAVWCVEDELVFRNTSITDMVRAVKAREEQLWGTQRPHLRVTDAEALVIAEMQREHKYPCAAARRDDLDAAVNALRHATQRRKYRIHPRCKNLIAHMKSGVWNTARTGFARMGSFGHFDGVAAAMYFERHVSKSRNPYPAHDAGVTAWTHHLAESNGISTEAKAFSGLRSKWRRPKA